MKRCRWLFENPVAKNFVCGNDSFAPRSNIERMREDFPEPTLRNIRSVFSWENRLTSFSDES